MKRDLFHSGVEHCGGVTTFQSTIVGKVISRIYLLDLVGVEKFMGPVEHIVLEFMGVVEDCKG